jgi:hypothetical protein
MRKLRRLPWRIPKSHNGAANRAEAAPEREARKRPEQPVREPIEREAPAQPVAFTAGRYVYGYTATTRCNTEIRRKTRHRVETLPHLPAAR